MYFLFQIFMYQSTIIAFKNAPFLSVFQSAKTSNFRTLLITIENALPDNIFIFLHCNGDT